MKNTENQTKLQEAAKLFGFKNYKAFGADKVFKTYEEFVKSDELKEVHSGFQSWTSIKEDIFELAYVVGDNVYVIYKIEGIRYLKQEQIGSSIDNSGVYAVIYTPIGFIIKKDICYKSCLKNERIWRDFDYTLTSVYTD